MRRGMLWRRGTPHLLPGGSAVIGARLHGCCCCIVRDEIRCDSLALLHHQTSVWLQKYTYRTHYQGAPVIKAYWLLGVPVVKVELYGDGARLTC